MTEILRKRPRKATLDRASTDGGSLMTAQLVPLLAGSAPPISIVRQVILIGRHPDCDVRIDVPEVSRRHCCLALAYDRVVIRDLGSQNGVRVNGKLVEEVQLQPGDEVAIAQFLYRLDWALPPTTKVSTNSPKRISPAASPEIVELDDDFMPLSE
ncbi:FHA domain-containing protein [Tundrisphaera lichenicola]|uniref:FHA domain-containing protein n=1 Tax=Tundrisphaera lichenicola TaxID=2029860 RepID=UPI003EB71087